MSCMNEMQGRGTDHLHLTNITCSNDLVRGPQVMIMSQVHPGVWPDLFQWRILIWKVHNDIKALALWWCGVHVQHKPEPDKTSKRWTPNMEEEITKLCPQTWRCWLVWLSQKNHINCKEQSLGSSAEAALRFRWDDSEFPTLTANNMDTSLTSTLSGSSKHTDWCKL